MLYQLPSEDLYVSQEDLADAPREVVHYLRNLEEKKKEKTKHKTQQEELGELLNLLLDTVQKLFEQDALRNTAHSEALSWPGFLSKAHAFVALIKALLIEDLGTGLPSVESLENAMQTENEQPQAQVQAESQAESQAPALRITGSAFKTTEQSEDSWSGEASGLPFDDSVVMVDMPAEAATHSQDSRQEPTHDGVQDSVPVIETVEVRVPPRTPRTSTNVESLTTQHSGPVALRTQSIVRTSTSGLLRKRSTPSQENSDTGTESSEPPPKRKNEETPSPEILAEELLSSHAAKRIRCHALAHKRDAPALPKPWNEHEDWTKQTADLLNLASKWDERSEYSRLVGLILRTHGVERLYSKARSIFQVDEPGRDPYLPIQFVDKVLPDLRKSRSPASLSKWLTHTRTLIKLIDYLPFIPLGSRGDITCRHYERLASGDLQRLRKILDNSPHAQRLSRIGRAFRECILQSQTFVWEDISCEDLAKLPDDVFLHLLTVRRGADHESMKLGSVGKQCNLCEGEICELYTNGQGVVSQHLLSPTREFDDWEEVSSPDTTAQHDNNGTIGLYQTGISETPFLASTSLPACEGNLASKLLVLSYDAVWQASPQLQLALPTTVADTAESVDFALKGNIDGLKRLFSIGLASPRDTSHSRGYSLVRWAIYGGHIGLHQYKIVQFLLDLGAPVDNESYEVVMYWSLREKYSVADKHALRSITRQDRNWFEEQRFPLIHQIICGQSTKSLRDELAENANAVFDTDAKGRTALDWATARGQLDDMKLLIRSGANPNSMDFRGRTTILTAVDSHNLEALRILLKAGANPNPQMPEGLSRSSPLTSASLNRQAGMIKLLIEFRADINAANPEGLTALHSAAVLQTDECAAVLLQNGAVLEYMPTNGRTALMTAIEHNSHAVLRLFLAKRAEPLDGIQILPIIARHADLETMTILASSKSLDPNGRVDLLTSGAIFYSRLDQNDMLKYTFETLISAYTGVAPPPPSCWDTSNMDSALL